MIHGSVKQPIGSTLDFRARSLRVDSARDLESKENWQWTDPSLRFKITWTHTCGSHASGGYAHANRVGYLHGPPGRRERGRDGGMGSYQGVHVITMPEISEIVHHSSLLQPFAAVLDRAQEQSQMVVAVTIAMPSTRCPLRVMGKVGGEDELDTDSWGEETENAQNAQHYYDIGLVRLPWPAVPLCCDSDDSDAV